MVRGGVLPALCSEVHDEPGIGLEAMVVVDNVACGPAIGGTRMAPECVCEDGWAHDTDWLYINDCSVSINERQLVLIVVVVVHAAVAVVALVRLASLPPSEGVAFRQRFLGGRVRVAGHRGCSAGQGRGSGWGSRSG